jgi:hypothetical protein
LNKINQAKDVSSYENVRRISYQQMIALSIGVPVSIFSLKVILPKIGLKHLQTFSFIVMGITFLIFSLVFDLLIKQDNKNALVVVYCFALTSVQSGAKITTFAIPSTVFHKADRMLYNGISAGDISELSINMLLCITYLKKLCYCQFIDFYYLIILICFFLHLNIYSYNSYSNLFF